MAIIKPAVDAAGVVSTDPVQAITGSAIAIVVDDHPLVASGIAEFLMTHCGMSQVHTAHSAQDCLALIAEGTAPELIIIDFWLPDGTAAELVSQLAAINPLIRLLATSGDEDAAVMLKAREAGADGFVHKQAAAEIFSEVVAAVRRGEPHFPPLPARLLDLPHRRDVPLSASDLGLTVRQGEILGMMLRGFPNKRIARDIGVSEYTVKEHVTGILNRLGVSNRIEAITLLRGRKLGN